MKRSQQTPARSSSVDLLALAEYVEQFSTKTVAVLGDFVVDEFQYGEISRVSREAPVLILRHRETHLVPGGGANAANNLAALGARVLPITAVGHDHAGNALIAYFRAKARRCFRHPPRQSPYDSDKNAFSCRLGAYRRPAGSPRRSRTADAHSTARVTRHIEQSSCEQSFVARMRSPFPTTALGSPHLLWSGK